MEKKKELMASWPAAEIKTNASFVSRCDEWICVYTYAWKYVTFPSSLSLCCVEDILAYKLQNQYGIIEEEQTLPRNSQVVTMPLSKSLGFLRG